MRAATVVTARLGSSRLPRKLLADLAGRSVLERVLDRVAQAQLPELLLVATTAEAEDDELADAAERWGAQVFRGASQDVLVRWRDAARAHGIDLLVNCDGDDVFCDPIFIDRVVEEYRATSAEYITCSGLPFGTAPTGVALTGLERICARKAETNTEGQGRFFDVPGIVSRAVIAAPPELALAEARLTLDYPEDLELFRAILSHLGGGT